ncbi:hypothetical protein [Rhizobium sp. Leaf386]|uniref:hypothetical protein n=1 Tax=Rhizobium sp. Leaf386 TaxID=1736359 RepID=UPI000714A35C|nr:hypothetical protein [Rhizobium sp. Leaf386]KQS84144.1 hypothetical protein ASG50_30110 [Rhizobium sp. Leaf386]
MTDHVPTIEEQEAAWFRYMDARRDYLDAKADFERLYLAGDMPPAGASGRANVEIFPIHRTRAPGRIDGGAA